MGGFLPSNRKKLTKSIDSLLDGITYQRTLFSDLFSTNSYIYNKEYNDGYCTIFDSSTYVLDGGYIGYSSYASNYTETIIFTLFSNIYIYLKEPSYFINTITKDSPVKLNSIRIKSIDNIISAVITGKINSSTDKIITKYPIVINPSTYIISQFHNVLDSVAANFNINLNRLIENYDTIGYLFGPTLNPISYKQKGYNFVIRNSPLFMDPQVNPGGNYYFFGTKLFNRNIYFDYGNNVLVSNTTTISDKIKNTCLKVVAYDSFTDGGLDPLAYNNWQFFKMNLDEQTVSNNFIFPFETYIGYDTAETPPLRLHNGLIRLDSDLPSISMDNWERIVLTGNPYFDPPNDFTNFASSILWSPESSFSNITLNVETKLSDSKDNVIQENITNISQSNNSININDSTWNKTNNTLEFSNNNTGLNSIIDAVTIRIPFATGVVTRTYVFGDTDKYAYSDDGCITWTTKIFTGSNGPLSLTAISCVEVSEVEIPISIDTSSNNIDNSDNVDIQSHELIGLDGVRKNPIFNLGNSSNTIWSKNEPFAEPAMRKESTAAVILISTTFEVRYLTIMVEESTTNPSKHTIVESVWYLAPINGGASSMLLTSYSQLTFKNGGFIYQDPNSIPTDQYQFTDTRSNRMLTTNSDVTKLLIVGHPDGSVYATAIVFFRKDMDLVSVLYNTGTSSSYQMTGGITAAIGIGEIIPNPSASDLNIPYKLFNNTTSYNTVKTYRPIFSNESGHDFMNIYPDRINPVSAAPADRVLDNDGDEVVRIEYVPAVINRGSETERTFLDYSVPSPPLIVYKAKTNGLSAIPGYRLTILKKSGAVISIGIDISGEAYPVYSQNSTVNTGSRFMQGWLGYDIINGTIQYRTNKIAIDSIIRTIHYNVDYGIMSKSRVQNSTIIDNYSTIPSNGTGTLDGKYIIPWASYSSEVVMGFKASGQIYGSGTSIDGITAYSNSTEPATGTNLGRGDSTNAAILGLVDTDIDRHITLDGVFFICPTGLYSDYLKTGFSIIDFSDLGFKNIRTSFLKSGALCDGFGTRIRFRILQPAWLGTRAEVRYYDPVGAAQHLLIAEKDGKDWLCTISDFSEDYGQIGNIVQSLPDLGSPYICATSTAFMSYTATQNAVNYPNDPAMANMPRYGYVAAFTEDGQCVTARTSRIFTDKTYIKAGSAEIDTDGPDHKFGNKQSFNLTEAMTFDPDEVSLMRTEEITGTNAVKVTAYKIKGAIGAPGSIQGDPFRMDLGGFGPYNQPLDMVEPYLYGKDCCPLIAEYTYNGVTKQTYDIVFQKTYEIGDDGTLTEGSGTPISVVDNTELMASGLPAEIILGDGYFKSHIYDIVESPGDVSVFHNSQGTIPIDVNGSGYLSMDNIFKTGFDPEVQNLRLYLMKEGFIVRANGDLFY